MNYLRLKHAELESKLVIISLLTVILLAAGTAATVITPVNGLVGSTAQRFYTNNLVVSMTLFGINKTTGETFAFVNAQGLVKAGMFNATKLEMQGNRTDGIAQTNIVFPNIRLNPGAQFTTCVVVPKNTKMTCVTDIKTPYARPQYVDISLQ